MSGSLTPLTHRVNCSCSASSGPLSHQTPIQPPDSFVVPGLQNTASCPPVPSSPNKPCSCPTPCPAIPPQECPPFPHDAWQTPVHLSTPPGRLLGPVLFPQPVLCSLTCTGCPTALQQFTVPSARGLCFSKCGPGTRVSVSRAVRGCGMCQMQTPGPHPHLMRQNLWGRGLHTGPSHRLSGGGACTLVPPKLPRDS